MSTEAERNETIRRALVQLLSGLAKQHDAPESASMHFDQAICELSKATDWRPEDAEHRAIIADAFRHMRLLELFRRKEQ